MRGRGGFVQAEALSARTAHGRLPYRRHLSLSVACGQRKEPDEIGAANQISGMDLLNSTPARRFVRHMSRQFRLSISGLMISVNSAGKLISVLTSISAP
jgi:hypothetical protein